MSMNKTLIIVDVQYDFMEGGALAVKGANTAYAKRIEEIKPLFNQVILTADYHPANHVSFTTFPPHCIAGTPGADIAIEANGNVLLKGEDKETEEFSAFSNGKNVKGITGDEVYVLGLAGDYCVKQTLLDLMQYIPIKKLYAIKDLIYSVDGTRYENTDYFDGKVTFINSNQLT